MIVVPYLQADGRAPRAGEGDLFHSASSGSRSRHRRADVGQVVIDYVVACSAAARRRGSSGSHTRSQQALLLLHRPRLERVERPLDGRRRGHAAAAALVDVLDDPAASPTSAAAAARVGTVPHPKAATCGDGHTDHFPAFGKTPFNYKIILANSKWWKQSEFPSYCGYKTILPQKLPGEYLPPVRDVQPSDAPRPERTHSQGPRVVHGVVQVLVRLPQRRP